MVKRFVLVVVERVLHAGRARGLHAVNLDFGAQALDGERHTGDQATAANGHDDRIHIGQLVENFQADGALARDDQLVIVRVDEGHTGLLLEFDRAVMGVVVGALDKLDLSAQALGAFHFHNGGAVGHADHAFNAHAGGGQRHALRMVASRAGDHALGALFLRQLADFIVRAGP